MSKGAETKERFVESTVRLMRRTGFNGTGVLDVIADSGAPRGSLYFHFPGGKEELAVSAVARVRDDICAWVERTTIEQFFHQYARWMEKTDCQDGCPVAALASDGSHSPRLLAAAQDALLAMQDAFAAKLVAAGHTPARAEELGSTLVCMFEGAIIMGRARRDAAPMRQAYDRLKPLVEAIA
ncbi:MAG: hypothetical protein QOK05_2363 [Chloroflexota bacterium]|jgi:TetR/AcrR family transcriptional repressor of lmrAB and yxaGH operons|nr:hypothetical protein [Chloroflexota bacterium]